MKANILSQQAFMRDPRPFVESMRDEGELIEMRLPIIGRTWVALTQELCGLILKDSERFPIRRDGKVIGLRWWMPGIFRSLANNMLTFDEPDHKRLRTIVDEAFHRRSIAAMQPAIDRIARRLADQLFDGEAQPDVVARFARQVPLAVICEMLGLPDSDRPRFSAWADGLARVTGLAGFFLLVPRLRALRNYLAARIEEARHRGGEGLIVRLVQEQAAGAPISDEEIVAMVFLLLVAGHETTTHLISGSVRLLLEDTARRDWLAADPARLPLAVEEFLRFVAPVQFSKPRYVAEATTLGGRQLAKGDRVMAMIAAANLDPGAVELPDRFDMERHPNRHISFGTGIHFCLGHQLARFETQAALEALFARWPRLELAAPADTIRWRERFGMRAMVKLPVRPG